MCNDLECCNLLTPNDALFITRYIIFYNYWQYFHLSVREQFIKLQEIIEICLVYPCDVKYFPTDTIMGMRTILITINQFHSEIQWDDTDWINDSHRNQLNYECDFRHFPRIPRPSTKQRRFGSSIEEKSILSAIDEIKTIKQLLIANLPMALI